MKKGISLPLNAIILIIIGVTVLIAVLIAFTTNLFGNTETAQMDSAVTRGCTIFKYQLGCNLSRVSGESGGLSDDANAAEFVYTISGREYRLNQLCQQVRGVGTLPECCGCEAVQ